MGVKLLSEVYCGLSIENKIYNFNPEWTTMRYISCCKWASVPVALRHFLRFFKATFWKTVNDLLIDDN